MIINEIYTIRVSSTIKSDDRMRMKVIILKIQVTQSHTNYHSFEKRTINRCSSIFYLNKRITTTLI